MFKQGIQFHVLGFLKKRLMEKTDDYTPSQMSDSKRPASAPPAERKSPAAQVAWRSGTD